MQDRLRVRMTAKTNRAGKRYFEGLTKLPVLVDLSDTVVLFFPPDKETGDAELVIRKWDVAGNGSETEG